MKFQRIYPKGAPCSEPGCPHPIHAKGMCRLHYSRYRTSLHVVKNTRKCKVCGASPVEAREMCGPHYERFRQGKNVNTPIRSIVPHALRSKVCTYNECGKPVHARNVCRSHYYKLFVDKNRKVSV